MLGVGEFGPLGPRGTEIPAGIGATDAPSPSITTMALHDARPPLDDERLAWAVLASIVSLAPPLFMALIRTHGSARRVLDAAGGGVVGPVEADADGSMAELVSVLDEAAHGEQALAEDIDRLGLTVTIVDDEEYPSRLRTIDLAPPVLFVLGDPMALDAARSVAVVGTRRPTEAGRLTASRIAGALARLEAVVGSGLAIGIDGAAHAAAVAEAGRTIAVIAGGHDRLYPSAHERLAREIVATGGAIVSEMAPRTPPLGHYFIQRNRLIAGLADATVVVEAPSRSGALSTARWALEQGRECFLVPGPIDAPTSAGCLSLLRAYSPVARIVAGVGELMEDLGLIDDVVRKGTRGRRSRDGAIILSELGPTEASVARHLLDGLTSVDEIVAATALPAGSVLGTLTLLEMRGWVTGMYGRYRPAGRLATADPGR